MKPSRQPHWHVRTTTGAVLGPMGTQDVVEQLLAQRLSGREWAKCTPTGAWVPVAALSQFKHFCSLDVDESPAVPAPTRLLGLCAAVLVAFGIGLWVL